MNAPALSRVGAGDAPYLHTCSCRGRGRGEGRGRGSRPDDPNQCPITTDRDGKLVLKATIMIMRELAGAVIGRGGEHVTAIRAETGALIHVCRPDFNTGAPLLNLS